MYHISNIHVDVFRQFLTQVSLWLKMPQTKHLNKNNPGRCESPTRMDSTSIASGASIDLTSEFRWVLVSSFRCRMEWTWQFQIPDSMCFFPEKGRENTKNNWKKEKQILHRQIIHVLKGTSHLIYQKLRKQSGMCIKEQGEFWWEWCTN